MANIPKFGKKIPLILYNNDQNTINYELIICQHMIAIMAYGCDKWGMGMN